MCGSWCASCGARGYRAELVSVPFKWYPKDEILPHAAAWRLLDLSESNGRPVDPVIATKFPSYFARHPNKVAWLIHQYRAAYELCGTTTAISATRARRGLRDTLIRLDTEMLVEWRVDDRQRVPVQLDQAIVVDRAEEVDRSARFESAASRSTCARCVPSPATTRRTGRSTEAIAETIGSTRFTDSSRPTDST